MIRKFVVYFTTSKGDRAYQEFTVDSDKFRSEEEMMKMVNSHAKEFPDSGLREITQILNHLID